MPRVSSAHAPDSLGAADGDATTGAGAMGALGGTRNESATSATAMAATTAAARWTALRARGGGDRAGGGESGFDEHAHAAPKIVLGDIQSGDEAHDLVVRPAGDQ